MSAASSLAETLPYVMAAPQAVQDLRGLRIPAELPPAAKGLPPERFYYEEEPPRLTPLGGLLHRALAGMPGEARARLREAAPQVRAKRVREALGALKEASELEDQGFAAAYQDLVEAYVDAARRALDAAGPARAKLPPPPGRERKAEAPL